MLDVNIIRKYDWSTEALMPIQQHYFVSEDKSRMLVEDLCEALEAGSPNATLVRSNKGSTGYTFLATVPSSHIAGCSELDTVNLVCKWQGEDLCKVEAFGAQIFDIFAFNPPPTYCISGESPLSGRLMSYALEKVPAMESLVGTLPFLLMPRLMCNNLEDVARSGQFLALDPSEKEKLIYKFGRIAAVDMLIGNNDRFLKFPLIEEGAAAPEASVINPGNILIYLNQDKRCIGEIYPIDSCPSMHLIPKEKALEYSHGLVHLFGSTSPEIDSDTESDWNPQFYVNHFHQIFVQFVVAPDAYATQFAKGFVTVMNCPIDQIDDLQALTQEAFARGIKDQLSTISEFGGYPEEILGLPEDGSDLYFVKLLFKKNIEHLQQSSHSHAACAAAAE